MVLTARSPRRQITKEAQRYGVKNISRLNRLQLVTMIQESLHTTKRPEIDESTRQTIFYTLAHNETVPPAIRQEALTFAPAQVTKSFEFCIDELLCNKKNEGIPD